ncbi:MAG TPA: dienelactone hydrolase family protein [Caulobacteraceae bacterium]|nr:dienelactone hydrolase family protein [Caulobacteraceae bacterium]
MQDRVLDDLTLLLPPLLRSLEALGFVARNLDPGRYGAVLEVIGAPEDALRLVRPDFEAWPPELSAMRERLESARDWVLEAFDGLRSAPDEPDGLRAAFRALRLAPRAQEALYPLAAGLPPVSRFFLDPSRRDDAALQARLTGGEPREDAGLVRIDDPSAGRGGFSMYVPEDYTPERSWPLVMALHGGGGTGRAFLWSWLRDARTFGAVLVAPTSVGATWALSGPDGDTPNLARILDRVQGGWSIDPRRMLLTGMSDGGTFTYVSGLEAASPFTHLAPACASFHPMIAQMADPDRMRDLPIYLVHGARDWMFSVDVARGAHEALKAAGANVTYREIDDLSHAYPREVNPAILGWLDGDGGEA